MKYRLPFIFYFLVLMSMSNLLSSCGEDKIPVDLIVHNAHVYTVDSTFSEQQAFAIQNGKFVAVGSNSEILSNYTSAYMLNAQKYYILPGLIDAHAHLYFLGQQLDEADLSKAKSFQEVITILQAYRAANPDKKWLKGFGWNQNNWTPSQLPTKELLDEAFPDIPVFLKRIDEHAAVINQKAIAIANLNRFTPMPKGGSIGLDENKQPNGLIFETAMGLILKHIPQPSEDEKKQILLNAQKMCLKYGLTSVGDALITKDIFELLDSMHREGSLKLRIYAMLDPTKETQAYFLEKGKVKTERLHAGALKLFADGTLGSYGAAMLEPYMDSLDTKGALWRSVEEYRELIQKFAEKGFQVNTHCIGDSANRVFLDLYSEFLKEGNDLRWRIEHAQVVHPDDMDKFGKYNIIPSVQPTHATSDMAWVEKRLGKIRLRHAYAFQKLYEQNKLIAFGTDFPIEHVNPFYTFHAAVARKDGLGHPKEGFQMENAVSREVALKAMTIWAAYAAFEEHEKGSIEAGKFADFIMIDTDIMNTDEHLLRNTNVLQTYINGERVYKSEY